MRLRPIIGFEGRYLISENGDIISIFANRKKLKPCTTIDGYKFIRLYDNHKHTFRIHRLVAMNFIPNPNNKPQVNHIDGNKNNNSVSNLEWVDQFENMRHAIDNGLFPRRDGAHNPRAKIVINLFTGIFYDTAKEAAIAHEIPATTLRGYLNGSNTNYSDMKYA